MNPSFRHFTITPAGWLVLGALALAMPLVASAQTSSAQRPTVVLVHGAFADSSSWNGVVTRLHAKGYVVVAAANELRSVKGDAASVASLVKSIHGPVVLVGHSYGGSVISVAATVLDNVKALVYVAAFAPEVGESAGELAGRFPGSSLGQALAPPVALPDGGKDLYIKQDRFHAQFAADVTAAQASLMAASSRPPHRHSWPSEPTRARPWWSRAPHMS